MSRSLTYFGRADASRVAIDQLATQHVFRGMENSVKWNAKDDGVQVVVGIKGSGKTELRRYLESQSDTYNFNLGENRGYLNQDVSDIKEESGRIKDVIAAALLQELAQRVAASSRSKTANKLRDVCSKSLEVLGNIPSGIEAEFAGVTIKLGEILKSEKDAVLESTIDELVEAVVKVLSSTGKRGAIMIDDVEVVFRGIQRNPLFLEGAARAVEEINYRCLDKIHALMFVKYGLWRTWVVRQQEYDKVRDVIDFLTWDHESLVELIARRVATARPDGNQVTDVEALWAKEFSWNGEFDEFTRHCTQYCVSGPRDMVALCNLAGVQAGNEPISQGDIDAVLGKYSDERLNALNGDFSETYPGINSLVEHVFYEAPPIMTGAKLVERIFKKAQRNSQVDKQFEGVPWFGYATKETLAWVMYQVGVVGVESDHGTTYAIQNPNLPIADLLAKNVCVHPAFRPHLNITGTE